jgi:hypothetical protein
MTANLADYVQISSNSAYDPLYSLGGGNCTGFSQYSTMYTRYIVERVIIEAHFVNNASNGAGREVKAFIRAVPTGQVASFPGVGALSQSDVVEAQGCKSCTVTYINGGFRDATATLHTEYVPWRMEGLPNEASDFVNLSSLCTGDPVRQGVIFVGTISSVSGAGMTCDLDLTVTYVTRFFEPVITST